MPNFFARIILVIITSFFFFPFYFTFLPSVNTKMILAAVGLCTFISQMAQKKQGLINMELFHLSIYALGVSFVSFVSTALNDTPDDSYVYYFVSMFVWLGAGFFVTEMIRKVHGYISIELVCIYLITVGVFQCILALMIDTIPTVKSFIDSFLAGEGFMGKNEDRLYGLGCALDVAGSRFSVLLVMIAFLLPRIASKARTGIPTILLLAAYGVIATIGNIIARTTTIGLIVSIIYLLFVMYSQSVIKGTVKKRLGQQIGIFTLLTVTLITFLYQTNIQWHNYIYFGFEGFFSLIEKGRWEVHSNEMLKGQFIFPETIKSWIIGEGYMASTDIDPYYIGKDWHGFYKGTDVGYSRFLLYFGIIGLSTFSAFLIKICNICAKHFKEYQVMFYMMLLLNFIIWFKVSSDIFLAFVPFLCMALNAQISGNQQESWNTI